MKNNKGINGIVIISVFFVFALAMVYGTLYIFNHQISTDKYFEKYNKITNNNLKELILNQNKIDEKIKEISTNGGYTLEEPCILENPYGLSPLSALIIFNTKDETSIRVSINDELVTTVEKSKNHIIPIYGLFTNTNNIVTLTNDFGDVKEVSIQTDSLNGYIKEYNVKESLKDKSHLFLLGDLNSSNSYLRGFDYNNNLIFYLEFDYISAANFYSNNFYISYNSKYSKNSNIQDLKIEMDYLGRIYSINKSTGDLTNTSNLHLDGAEYLATSVNLYKDSISNYQISKVVDNNSYTTPIKMNTSSLEKVLTDAEIYGKEYNLALNGEYITYDFEEDITLLMVTKNSNYTYAYELTDKNIIKTGISDDVSLFVISEDKYYTLLTTLKL